MPPSFAIFNLEFAIFFSVMGVIFSREAPTLASDSPRAHTSGMRSGTIVELTLLIILSFIDVAFIFGKKRQRLGDRVAHTLVVKLSVDFEDRVATYRDGQLQHVGVVEEVTEGGEVKKVRSKWGAGGEFVHDPDAVPDVYGSPTVVTNR